MKKNKWSQERIKACTATWTDEQKSFFSQLYIQALAGRARHMHYKDAISVQSVQLEQLFLKGYREKVECMIYVWDDAYIFGDVKSKKGKTSTMAWKFQPEAFEVIKSWGMLKVEMPKYVDNKYVCIERPNVAYIDAWLAKGPEAFEKIEHYQSLFLYSLNIDRESNTVTVPYRRIKGKSGRLFSTVPSFQTLPKAVRKHIMPEDVIEYDFQNCHMAFFLAYAMKYSIKSAALERLVKTREEVLKEIMSYYGCTREDAKVLCLLISYGASLHYNMETGKGAYTEWFNELETRNEPVCKDGFHKPMKFLEELKTEMKEVTSNVLSNEALAESLKHLTYKASAMSLFIQAREDDILHVMCDVFRKAGAVIAAYQFDGVASTIVSDETVKDAENAITVFAKDKLDIELDMKIVAKKL